MKIRELIIDNFRAYNTTKNNPFSLIIEDKPIVLIYGNNGLGKSSLYDAIEWGITGKIERYDAKSAEKNNYYILKNHFSNRDDGYVEIKFDDNFKIKRSLKKKIRTNSDYSEGKLENKLEKTNILNHLVEADYRDKIKLQDHFNVSHLLSQELLNSFIKEKNEGERYKIFLSLYGLNNDNKKTDQIKEKISDINSFENKTDTKLLEISKNVLELKDEQKGNDNNDERIMLEREFKNSFQNKEVRLEVFKSLSEEPTTRRNDILSCLKVLNLQKEILLEDNFFEENNKNIIKIKKNKKELLEVIKALKEFELIKKIAEKKEFFINYGELVKEEDRKQVEKSQIDLKIKKIQNLKSDLEILNYYKEIDNDNVEKYFTNIKLIEELETTIKEKKDSYIKISEVKNLFLTTSGKLLNNIEYEKCPLCENENFNQNEIIEKLKKDLEDNVDPLILEKKEKIIKLEEEQKGLSNRNNTIIKKMKIQNKRELESELNSQNKLEKYFEKLASLKPSYKNVKESLEKLNISFENFGSKKICLEEILKRNSDTIISANEKLELNKKKLEEIETENLNEFNKLKKEKVTLEKINKEIENKNKELTSINGNLENLSKLITIYEDDELLNKINKKEKEKKSLEKDSQYLKDAAKDLEKLKEYLEEEILIQVKEKTERYKKKIQNLYKTLNPHRYFNNVKIIVDGRNGNKNNVLRIEIYDENNKEVTNNPAYIFSSAQTNILAISIFLTFALDSNWSKLETILLDDPIQNMDDINIYAFTDLIKRVSEKKQVILSTHDDRVKNFMLKKFGEENVQVVNFESYGKLAD